MTATNMIVGKPSQTALHVAAARAAHLRFDSPPYLLEDRCAESLLGEHADELIASYADNGSWLLVENRLAIPLRARYVEDRLADAYRAGTRQLVVLGAGLDSYAFRSPGDQADLRIYEVDHPDTQEWKVARLAQLAWQIPPSLSFVACDFEQIDVSEALRETTFDPQLPAVVSWMGVLYYLTPSTALRALRDLYSILAPGGEVVFDYQFPFDELSDRYQDVPRTMNQYLNSVGEPQRNRYRRGSIEDTLRDAGFDQVILERPEAIYERYYAPLASTIPMSERFGLAVAKRSDSSAG